MRRKATFHPVAASWRHRRAIVGQNTTEAVGDPLARDIHLTPIGFIQARAAREKSSFAAARRPEHRENLATADSQDDAAQCESFLFACMVKAVEIDGFEYRRAHYQAKLSDISFH